MYFRSISLVICLVLATVPSWAEPTLRALGKGTEVLAEFIGKGKWVIVKIWASDCHVCNQKAHQYVDFHEFHGDRDAIMLGISLDGNDPAAAQAFIDRHGVSYPNLLTDVMGGAQLFSSLTGQQWIGTPSFLVYDPAGELRAQQVGTVPIELIERFINSN